MNKKNLLNRILFIVLMLAFFAFQVPSALGAGITAHSIPGGHGVLQLEGTAPPGTLVSLAVTDTGTGWRRHLDQVRADSSGRFTVLAPLAAGSYQVEVAGGGDSCVLAAEVSPGGGGTPPPGGAGGEPSVACLEIRGDSRLGLILPRTAWTFAAGERKNVLELLRSVLAEKGIGYRIESSGYVSAIGGLRERDRGPLSGWLYRINGVFPGTSGNYCYLNNGDFVEFVYTLDGGKDVGAFLVEEEKQPLPPKPPVPEKEKGKKELREDLPPAELPPEEAMNELARRGIARGTQRGLEPGRNITRAEFLTLLAQVGAFTPAAEPGGSFKDVNPWDWFRAIVEGASTAGVIGGFADGTFRPNAPLTRYHAAVILHNLNDRDPVRETDSAQNGLLPEWARPSVQYVFASNLMDNMPDNGFGGDFALTRGEAAQIILRYLAEAEAIQESEGQNRD